MHTKTMVCVVQDHIFNYLWAKIKKGMNVANEEELESECSFVVCCAYQSWNERLIFQKVRPGTQKRVDVHSSDMIINIK